MHGRVARFDHDGGLCERVGDRYRPDQRIRQVECVDIPGFRADEELGIVPFQLDYVGGELVCCDNSSWMLREAEYANAVTGVTT